MWMYCQSQWKPTKSQNTFSGSTDTLCLIWLHIPRYPLLFIYTVGHLRYVQGVGRYDIVHTVLDNPDHSGISHKHPMVVQNALDTSV